MSIDKNLEVPIPGTHRPKTPSNFNYYMAGSPSKYIFPHDGTKTLELMEDYLLGFIKDEEDKDKE